MERSFGRYKLLAANNSQTKTIQHIVFSVLEEYGLKKGAIDFCLDDVEQYYFQKGGYFAVLLNDKSEIVATGGLYKLDDKNVELRKMYMLSTYRGQGLGKFMLMALIEIAKELGFERIELETASVLQEAIGLYKKFGFKQHHPKHISNRCDQAFELILSNEDI